MAAVIGISADEVEALCRQVDGVVEVANYNQPKQTVVSGDVLAVNALEDLAQQAGASSVVRLKVGGAFHSPLMADVADEFGVDLENCVISTPDLPVLSAVTGQYVENPADIRALLHRQIVAPVRWLDTIRHAVEDGYDRIVEIGPGKVLTGFSRRIAPDTEAFAIASP
ncbi:ACP S-malonyltransferase [Rhodococcus sp. NPDC058521]|uniref:ACP S-malonyltransferase n=1 Tax=Rhodococcus sp. NPDC058521 TaxID=3346536 RepID=UPI003646FC49